jgi:CheY-like chemotaxis protein
MREYAKPYFGHEELPAGKYALLEVSDTGAGIKRDHVSRIFEPFFSQKSRTERSGSGLGLAVVHGIVKDHGGYIDVQSREGNGTTFSLYFPLTGEEKNTRSYAAAHKPVSGTGHILVVDDEAGQRFMARRGLQKAGYKVTLAVDGHHALEMFSEAKASGDGLPFDLVILDMIMEEGFDGLDTMMGIREMYSDIPVIIASGHAENGRSSAATDMGALWMPKPYDMNALLHEISQLLLGL